MRANERRGRQPLPQVSAVRPHQDPKKMRQSATPNPNNPNQKGGQNGRQKAGILPLLGRPALPLVNNPKLIPMIYHVKELV